MIDSAIKNKERINEFIAVTPELADNCLSEQDWEDLATMLELLKPFKLVTIMEQEKGTRFSSISSILWGYDFLMNQLEKARRRVKPEESQFCTACNLAWALLKKYYNETDNSTVHVFSMVLDPRLKMDYFR